MDTVLRYLRIFFVRSALSDERTCLQLICTSATGPRQRNSSRVKVSQNLIPHITVSFGLGLLSAASYNLQGYGGGILTSLHAGEVSSSTSTSKSYLTTDGQSASLSSYQATNWDPRPIFLSLHGYYFQAITAFWYGAPSLTRGRVSNLLYNCYWALPALSHSGPSHAEFVTISYCLIWDWVPLLSPIMTRRAKAEVFYPASTNTHALRIRSRCRPRRKYFYSLA
jgi:hypothetical protein